MLSYFAIQVARVGPILSSIDCNVMVYFHMKWLTSLYVAFA